MVEPNTSHQILVEYNPTEVGEDEKIVILNVTNPKKEDSSGRTITLRGKGSECRLDFTDYGSMFKEQFFVDKMENFIYPHNVII